MYDVKVLRQSRISSQSYATPATNCYVNMRENEWLTRNVARMILVTFSFTDSLRMSDSIGMILAFDLHTTFNDNKPLSGFLQKVMMAVVVVTTRILRCGILQSNHHCQHIKTPLFLQAGCPSCRPTNSVEALKAKQTFNQSPPQTPFPGGAGWPKFNQLEMVTTLPTNPVSWGSMHAISSYRGNRPTNTPTHPQTDRTDYNTLRCSFASAQFN